VPLIYYGKRYVFLGLVKYFQNANPADTSVDVSDYNSITVAETVPGVDSDVMITETTFGEPTTVFIKSAGTYFAVMPHVL
jgi:hypothetical protein